MKNISRAQSRTKLQILHADIRPLIERRLRRFSETGARGTDEELLAELVFCILTPQSNAEKCWEAVAQLKRNSLLRRPDPEKILSCLEKVRFKYTKAHRAYLVTRSFSPCGRVSFRKTLDTMSDNQQAREWLVLNIKGLGYKEASHFLRNIGRGKDLAILDRHILRCLCRTGAIKDIPSSLGKKRYAELEEEMKRFACKMKIPLDHLDLLFWYQAKGKVFK
jgi:N-glycosylase/DNA lyase